MEFDLSPIWFKPIDLSGFRKIIIIGDIHGCNTVLQEYLKDGLEDDCYFIFVGDYIDRGIENADVIKYLLSIKDKRNVLLLTGNHEINSLMRYAHDEKAFSKEFELVTKPQLAEFNKKDLRQLCRKFVQCAWFYFHEKEIFVCHGGIATMPENITYLATDQMIKGVGNYEDYEQVADTWMRTTKDNMYQIFGHRNTKASPVQMRDRVYNLEGRVEFGGCLRVVELDNEGFHCVEVKNKVFRPKEEFECTKEINSTDVAKLVIDMRNSKYIQEKQFGNISSFNFTKTAFQRRIWNGLTTHARGLFIDTSKMKIIARSYNKFDFVDSQLCPDLPELKNTLQFPLTTYVKENGFLGLLSYDEYTDGFRFCSKSMIGGEFADWFKNIFNKSITDDNKKAILDYLKENNVTFIFEVIDVEHDPHIIEYKESKVVLLDVVKNQLEFDTLPYSDLWDISHSFGLECKKKVLVLNTWEEFCAWYDYVQKPGYQLDGEYIEGYVIHDSNNFMFKLKTDYYVYWKRIRPIIAEVWHKGYIEGTSRLVDETQNRFYGFLRKLWAETEDKETLPKDIVTLRRMYESEDSFYRA